MYKNFKLYKAGFLTLSLFVCFVTMIVGVFAATQKNSEVKLGLVFNPEYLVKVEMGTGGTETNDYSLIYDSQNPSEDNFYIKSISADTINLNPNKLSPDKNGFVHLKFTSTDATRDLQAVVNCGTTTVKTNKLIVGKSQILSIQTGVAGDQPAKLGAIVLSIQFQDIPRIASLSCVSTINVYKFLPLADFNKQINAITVKAVYENGFSETLKLNTGYTISQTSFGLQSGLGVFNSLGSAGIITVVSKENSAIKKTISINVILPYTITAYAAADRPAMNSATNYEYYISMGTYAEGGVNYNIKWIVAGGCLEENYVEDYGAGKSVIFTTANKGAGEAKWNYTSSGGFTINNVSVKSLLLISQFCLGSSKWNSSESDGNSFFKPALINTYLNTTFFNASFNSAAKNFINTTTIPRTDSVNFNNTAKIFLLGDNSGYSHSTDSFGVNTYFTDASSKKSYSITNSSNLTSATAWYWWTRSNYGNGYFSMFVNPDGIVGNGSVAGFSGVRPVIIINVA